MIMLPVHSPRPLPEPLSGLAELALDLAWSWNHGGDRLWECIDAGLWEKTGNPWTILQLVSRHRLEVLAQNVEFLALLQSQLDERRAARAQPCWYQGVTNPNPLALVAYFSMEFGVSEALPLYSGGLGVLAGDVLKTASDLGIPMAGIGLLYQRGYFRQGISVAGGQLEYFPYNPPSMLPIRPLRDEAGEWVQIELPLPGRKLMLRAWQAQVGRVPLYLLDSNDPANSPRDRGITGELYGGDGENRLIQELVLGIGGWQLLEALGEGENVSVCHLNEGHAAFAALAHAAALSRRLNVDFDTALTAVRAGTLFTTHTPVAAAFDRFPRDLAAEYLAPIAEAYAQPLEQVLDLGRESDSDSRFNMAWMALRTAGALNGVSRLHARVSRHLFAPLFGRIPVAEVPVGVVTNGVHAPTWDSPEADRLWTECCGKERWRNEFADMRERIACHEDAAIWQMRAANRRRLVVEVSRRDVQARRQRGEVHGREEAALRGLDPGMLTLGFARRFTAYKRPALLLRDPIRLLRLLNDPNRPVQLIVAGKAHPQDDEGKRLIRVWQDFLRGPEIEGRVVFVEDYDLGIAAHLVQGVDLWINTPRRPWEASGTSGMKVLVNGGLNLSELDGWWAEAYSPDVGWALGDGKEHADIEANDQREAAALYDLLEREVIPQFYERDSSGIPRRWIARIRASMARLTPLYSTNRMLREYVERYYHPLAERFAGRTAAQGAGAREANRAAARLRKYWGRLHITAPHYQALNGGEVSVEAHAFIDGLDLEEIRVELYGEPREPGDAPESLALEPVEALVSTTAGHCFRARFMPRRPLEDYVLRLRPRGAKCLWPLECSEILWQR